MKRTRWMALVLLAAVLTGCAAQKSAQSEARTETVSAPEYKTDAAAQGSTDGAGNADAADGPSSQAETGEKTVLTLAGVGLWRYGWDWLARQFNAQSEKYVVELRDYYTGSCIDDGSSRPDDLGQYIADIDDAKTRLHTDLIVGNMPDMIVFDGLSPLTYLGKELLLDLDPYLKADAEIAPDDILCWDALHEYGGLYVMARQFVVETLMCSQDFYDAHKGWTVADYLEIERGLRSDQQMIYYMSPEEFLTQMGGQYLAKALDLENAACDFDNPEFIEILNGALECGQYGALDYAGTPAGRRLETGELMCCATWLDHPNSVTFDRVQSGKQLAYIGWPTTDGSCGSVAALYGDIGAFVSTNCPEGCWEFIKYVLQNVSDSGYAYYGSPVYAPLMRKQVAQQNETAGKYTTASESDVEAYIAAANACRAMGYRDESVMQIIRYEGATMMQGGQTPQEAARKFQARASLYMREA